MDTRDKTNFALASFQVLEDQLLDCMDYLPFIDANRQAISPKFIPIIMESCCLIDSIFHEIGTNDGEKRLTFKKYGELFETKFSLDRNASLFLVLPVRLLLPFKDWTKKPPSWWEAYNNLKHDRLNNYGIATFTNAVYSLAGLHQVMAKQRDFVAAFLKAGWIDTTNYNAIEDLGSAAHVGTIVDVIIESKLCASPSWENFVDPETSDELYFDVNYEANGLSERLRNLLFAHEDW